MATPFAGPGPLFCVLDGRRVMDAETVIPHDSPGEGQCLPATASARHDPVAAVRSLSAANHAAKTGLVDDVAGAVATRMEPPRVLYEGTRFAVLVEKSALRSGSMVAQRCGVLHDVAGVAGRPPFAVRGVMRASPQTLLLRLLLTFVA